MQTFIHKNGQQLGPFEEKTVLEMLKKGELLPNDLGFKKGEKDWQPLSKIFRDTSNFSLSELPQTAPDPKNFINQPVVDWAKVKLNKDIEIELKYDSLLMKILGYIAGLFFPMVFFVLWMQMVLKWMDGKTEYQQWYAPIVWAFWFIVFSSPFWVFWLILNRTRRKIIKRFTSEGLETRAGKKYLWKDLYQLNYSKTRNVRIGTDIYEKRLSSGIASALMSGSHKLKIDFVFANGIAVFPPLVKNQDELLKFISKMPVKIVWK